MARDIVESLAAIPNSTDDFTEVYWVVNRENGRMIERMASRLNAIDCGGEKKVLLSEQIYMDSALSYDSTPIDILTMSTSTGIVEITTDDPHGFSSGELVSLQCTGIDSQYEILNVNYNTITNYWPVANLSNADSVDTTYRTSTGATKAAASFTITNMYVYLATAPGTSKLRQFTLYKNGSPTDLSIGISGSSTTGSITTSVSFSGLLNDTFHIVEELINGASDSAFSIGMTIRTSVDKQIFLSSDRINGVNTIYHGVPNSGLRPVITGHTSYNSNSEMVRTASLFSTSGTIRNWEVRLIESTSYVGEYPVEGINSFYGDPSDASDYVSFNLYKYNLDTTSDTNQEFVRFTGSEADRKISSSSLYIEQGKFVRVELSKTQQNLNIQEPREVMEFYPDNVGERVFNCHMASSSTGIRYSSGTCHSLNSGEEAVEKFSVMPTSGTIKNLIVSAVTDTPNDPGNADNPLTVTFRKNGADTALTCTLGNNDSNAQDLTHSFTVQAGDRISISAYSELDPLGSSALSVAWTFVADDSLETPIFCDSWGDDLTSPNTPTTSTRNFLIPADNTGVYTGGGYVRLTEDVFEGLDHLEGEYVSILADGVSLPGATVVDGSVTASTAAGIVHIGLPYFSDLETLDIDITNDRDTTMARKVKVGNVNMGFVSSHGGWLGEDADSLYESFTDTIIGQNRQDLEFNEDLTTLNGATVLYDGVLRRPLNARWKHGGNVFFRQKEPKPVHITSIEPEVSIGGSI